MSVFAPFIREGLRYGARYVYQGLRAQDRLIDYTYRRTGLYNRGAVRGIKHGLVAGQIAGGTFKLGLPDFEQNAVQEQNGYVKKTNKFSKKYNRRSVSGRRSRSYNNRNNCKCC